MSAEAKGLGLTFTHPLSYSSSTALGAQIAALQVLYNQFQQLNLQGQFLGPEVSQGLWSLLGGLIAADQQGQTEVSDLQSQLNACLKVTQGGGAVTATAPAPTPGATPSGTVSVGATAGIATGTGLGGILLGYLLGRRR